MKQEVKERRFVTWKAKNMTHICKEGKKQTKNTMRKRIRKRMQNIKKEKIQKVKRIQTQ